MTDSGYCIYKLLNLHIYYVLYIPHSVPNALRHIPVFIFVFPEPVINLHIRSHDIIHALRTHQNDRNRSVVINVNDFSKTCQRNVEQNRIRCFPTRYRLLSLDVVASRGVSKSVFYILFSLGLNAFIT
jgi:hypothetical protein